ncbi:ArsR/SmtB family transcription factor [Acetobacter vaccinii]|mgnify:FL=1|nr:metalloregulator ArsR/SmtB family transcription factor [Acetobacter vaccinii]
MTKIVDCSPADNALELLKQLANPNRLAIVGSLLEGPRSVAELELVLSIRQPTLSQQITSLRDAGLIEGRREGRHTIYFLCDERVTSVMRFLATLYPDLLPAQLRILPPFGNMNCTDLPEMIVDMRLSAQDVY